MNRYTVRATRWDEGWELDIDGIGVTQAASLTAADRMVRSYLALDGYTDAKTADIVLEFPEYEGVVTETQGLQRDAEAATEAAARAARNLVAKLADIGLKGAEIAKVMSVSPQRISQLLDVKVSVSVGKTKPKTAAKSKSVARSKVPAAEVSRPATSAARAYKAAPKPAAARKAAAPARRRAKKTASGRSAKKA